MKARYIDNTIVSKGASQAGWLFGEPVIRYANSGYGGWTKAETSPLNQKGSGWLANLYGGAQSGDDWAAVYIPVNELPVTQFDTAYWSWYQTNAESMGLGMVVWIHDPEDFDKRAEVSQLANVSGLDKGAGWNSHEFSAATTQMFFYGENTTGTGLTAGTQYTWDEFQADTIFSGWSIYRISFDWGWDASGTYEDAWLAEVKLNGMYIPLKPSFNESVGGPTKTLYKATASDSSTVATAITPSSAFKRVRIKQISMCSTSATAANFEVYFHTGANIAADTTKAIALCNLDTDVRPSEQFNFGDDGPIGAVNEVVSVRTSANITTNGLFVITYKEE